MIINIIVILLSVAVLIMTFKADVICKKLLKIEEPSQNMILRVKMIAFAIAVVTFVVTVLF